ncbi:MAG: HEAT repeat domain-containing protein [Bryobacteraceae bacterium]
MSEHASRGPLSCQATSELLWLHLYGELEGRQDDAVEEHLAGCPECAARLEGEMALFASLDTADEPPGGLISECRRDLFSATRQAPAAKKSRWRLPVISEWLPLTWKPVGALALVTLGFLAGRSPVSVARGPAEPAPVASRVRAVEPGPNGQVQLVVEETTRHRVAGLPSDDRIRQLLLEAAQDPADPGLRVDSMDLLRRDSEVLDVRRTLMQALVADPNPGVRLKALDGLRPYTGDPEVRRSLAHVVLRDENAGLRTQAVDLLIQAKPRDMVDVLQQLVQREDNGYIRLRTQRALREMNASDDMF